MSFAIKAAIPDPQAETFAFDGAKTMYGGKHVAAGDRIFLFASESSGGRGLFARGVVVSAVAVPKIEGLERQTPRVAIVVRRCGIARRPLGRVELKNHDDWRDGRPETELNFKLYRQATDKLVGLSEATAAFLAAFFDPERPR